VGKGSTREGLKGKGEVGRLKRAGGGTRKRNCVHYRLIEFGRGRLTRHNSRGGMRATKKCTRKGKEWGQQHGK